MVIRQFLCLCPYRLGTVSQVINERLAAKSLLSLASTVILFSESHAIHEYISLLTAPESKSLQHMAWGISLTVNSVILCKRVEPKLKHLRNI